jgi:hypothetical protein
MVTVEKESKNWSYLIEMWMRRKSMKTRSMEKSG